MAETSTQSGASGTEGGSPPAIPGAPATATPGADAFAEERARLEAQRAEWQSKADRQAAEAARLQAELDAARAQSQTPAAPSPVDVKSVLREELQRVRQMDAAVASLREQYPGASEVFERVDQFDSVEQLQVAAEQAHARFTSQVGPAVEAAVTAALKPYVDKFGPLQTPPPAATPGAGDGMPTLDEVSRMGLKELDALEKAHPGYVDRLLDNSMSTGS